jgi:hypothetical protein
MAVTLLRYFPRRAKALGVIQDMMGPFSSFVLVVSLQTMRENLAVDSILQPAYAF